MLALRNDGVAWQGGAVFLLQFVAIIGQCISGVIQFTGARAFDPGTKAAQVDAFEAGAFHRGVDAVDEVLAVRRHGQIEQAILAFLFQPQLTVEDVGLVENVVVRITAFDLRTRIGGVADTRADTLRREFGDLYLDRRHVGILGIVVDADDGVAEVGRILDLALQRQQAIDVVFFADIERIDVTDDAFRIAFGAGNLQWPQREAWATVVLHRQVGLLIIGVNAGLRLGDAGGGVFVLLQLFQPLIFGSIPVFLAERRAGRQRPVLPDIGNARRILLHGSTRCGDVDRIDLCLRPGLYLQFDVFGAFLVLRLLHLDRRLGSEVTFRRC